MKIKKRQPAKLIRISSIYKGNLIDTGESTVFILNGETYQRVRVFGIVVDRHDFTDSDSPYSIITIDDSSDTIQLRLWKRIFTRENGYNYDTFQMIDGIKLGDVIDVIGIIKNYNGQYYISPHNITKNFDIDLEILRRAKFIDLDVENYGLNQETLPFEKNSYDKKVTKVNLHLKVLNNLESDLMKNSIDLLSKRLKIDQDKLKNILKELQLDGLIICPKEGYYLKI